jgi:hypothetical protein
MHKITPAILAAVVAALIVPAVAAARLPAPRLVGPANRASVQELPTISWRAVRHAAEYEYEISADPRFRSILGSGPGQGTSRTHNLAAALTKLVPDGTYSWRVRALNARGASGAWSRARRIVKHWSAAPKILGGSGVSVSWPATPLVLRWTGVPYAFKYIVTIATDPALSNVVLGSASQPTYTQGTSFVLPGTLANGSYYWAVTPVDAEGHRGTRSRVGVFTWTWPTTTAPNFTDLNPQVSQPLFSWNPVPGAARYEVEINQDPSFPAGSKWCCSAPTIGTSLAPQQNLANNSTYWWRVRALDANGHAGVWNNGGSFTKAFDATTPSISNLRVIDGTTGQPATGPTDTPIVTWDPVPGASLYNVTVGAWTGSFCNWAAGSAYSATTATTAWTPLGSPGVARPGYSERWPLAQLDVLPVTPGTWCLRVVARADDDALHGSVVGPPSYANRTNDPNAPAFTWVQSQSPLTGQPFQPFVAASDYIAPGGGAATELPPVLRWKWTPGATGFFVVIARDAQFTDIADLAFTNVPAYAPRLGLGEPLADKLGAYYWAVIPAEYINNHWQFNDAVASDSPQTFVKSSTPPAPLLPADGTAVSTWPTFRWTGVQNARNYTLQVSQDPSFGSLLDNVTTDSTAYTSSTTYPADTTLYWRVRGNDWAGHGLNWSQPQTFTRRLPASTPSSRNPRGGDGISVESWAAVPGAIAYDVHVDQGDGTSNEYTVDSPAFAATSRYGLGTLHWQVRPLFPTTGFATVGGPFFSPQPYRLTLSAPRGARGVKSGSRLVISWRPDPAAKQYEVDVSTTDSFSTPLSFQRVDGTSWAPDIDLASPATHGRLYWRVAAVDSYGTVGSFATGSFLNGHPRKHGPHGRKRHHPHKRQLRSGHK